MMKRWILTSLFSLSIFLLSETSPSEGHGYIVRSIPADRTVVTRAPNTVQVWFSEGLEPKFSKIEVFNQRGEQVDPGDGGTDEQNNAKLVVSLPSSLPQGAYLVKLRPVFTSDGHAVDDTLVFWIGERVGDFNESGSGNTAVALEAIWRILLTLSLSVLYSTIFMYAMVLRPAWGRAQWALPPRIMRRLSLLLWSALLISILVNGLALIQITMKLFDASLSNVLQDDSLNIVLQGTNFGDVWQIRLVLLVAMLGIQVIAAQQSRNRPGSTHILWLVNGVLALFALGSMSLISHASGSPILPLISVFMDFIHLTAVGSWIGGLIVIALILRPAFAPLNPDQRGRALLSLLRRFSPLALIWVSLIIVTGIYAVSINMYRVNDFADSTYGLTLLAKLILMVPLLFLGMVHFVVVSPERSARLANWLQAHQRFTQLPQTLRVEAIFAIAVIIAAATLPATPPPQPPNARGEVEAMSKLATAGAYDVTVTVSPGVIGANSYDVRVAQNGEAANVDAVTLRFSYPERGLYTAPLTLESSEPGLWVGAGGDITQAAEWDVLIDIDTDQTNTQRAALRWEFAEEVKDASTRSPGIVNWFSVLLVAAVISAWTVPPAYRYGKSLDWTPQTLAIGAGSLVFTLAVTIGGAVLFSDTSRRLEEQRNPIPDAINPIFADQNSLVEGQTIYENRCVICHGSDGYGRRPAALNLSRPILPFSSTLADQGDDVLFRLLTRGIVGRHLYGTDLSEDERWHLINFIRHLE